MRLKLKLIIGFPHAEGSWDEVMKVIGQAHCLLHEKGIVRIQTDIRVGSRYVIYRMFGRRSRADVVILWE